MIWMLLLLPIHAPFFFPHFTQFVWMALLLVGFGLQWIFLARSDYSIFTQRKIFRHTKSVNMGTLLRIVTCWTDANENIFVLFPVLLLFRRLVVCYVFFRFIFYMFRFIFTKHISFSMPNAHQISTACMCVSVWTSIIYSSSRFRPCKRNIFTQNHFIFEIIFVLLFVVARQFQHI